MTGPGHRSEATYEVHRRREELLAPLQSVFGVVERRQTMPEFANVLLATRDNKLTVTGTDLEVELGATSTVSLWQPGDVTAARPRISPKGLACGLGGNRPPLGSGERSGPSTCPAELTPETEFEGSSCRSRHQARC
ncbi:MAG: hypothetical protein E6H00_03480 [Bacillati bacterium ANGP1]|uniref:DNA polymerase III beta sliding clamp N-terminal domain-containing protein n=1 Tax=Candidatus Segetimicrobium genomatis TaxID=2569760 RepID=A0A537K7H3_9BACT|nr:MAG: hypothetical protein E6H00_03480 [Terrabacteria group bacterium ANGP1]